MSIFKNKIAIVTGAASGIGQALARDLARQGVDVVPADVQINAANTFVAGICRSGGKASAHYLDVTDSDVVEGFVRRIAAEKGRLDYMFNNAGIAIIGEFRDFSTADWKRILDINVCGVLAGTAAAYGVMIRLGHESIETTQVYLDADLAMKQAVLDKTQPPEGKPGRYRPDDPLLAFLKGL